MNSTEKRIVNNAMHNISSTCDEAVSLYRLRGDDTYLILALYEVIKTNQTMYRQLEGIKNDQ